ncbi:MAG: hypothetical protein FWC97_09930 [Treponema sp.]|nr:hypothetical protein [Treponema sp.]
MLKRLDVYNSIFSARALFIAGLFMVSALVFNPSTELRVAQFLFFWFLAWLSGRRTKFFLTIFIILFIVVFNLIVPHGRVLFSIGQLRITSGALTAGIHRAFTLGALVMLSKVTVRQDLMLPGTFGRILGESMRIFSAMMNRKFHITGRNIIVQIDNLMLELSEQDYSPQSAVNIVKTKLVGYIVLIAVVLFSWLPWIFVI